MGLTPLLRCPYACRRSTFASLEALNKHIAHSHPEEPQLTIKDLLNLLSIKTEQGYLIIIKEVNLARNQKTL